MTTEVDFFSQYLAYTSGTEVPPFFNRWAAITGIGAFLGRSYYFQHGHFTINPNIYCMLIGSPGTRKSTSIKLMRATLKAAGYSTIAADKTTKEKFLLDLAGDTTLAGEDLATINIFGEGNESDTSEILIAADEFNDFIGLGNHDFISLLGNLWDYSGVYESRIKNGKSVSVPNPTISIIGGNTPTGFSLAFPPEILGQGFFSRLLLVYGEPTGRRITFPAAPDKEVIAALVQSLATIRKTCVGPATLTPRATYLLDKIYTNPVPMEDVRFESYANRRFSHLLKLCLIVSAARYSKEIGERDVVYANTILSHTEHLMPKALGEFGKARNSEVVHKIMQVLDSTHCVMTISDLWKYVIQDLERIQDLADILRNLAMADKIQQHKGGFLPKRKVLVETSSDTIDYTLLTPEELGKETSL